MSVVNAIPLIAAGDDGYSLTRSLRFRSSATAYLNRTFSTPTNALKFTWSGWVKRGTFGAQVIFGNGNINTGTTASAIYFDSADRLYLFDAGSFFIRQTNAVYRDPAAWYHIMFSVDKTTSVDVKLYVNGVQVTSFLDSRGTLLTAGNFNSAVATTMGKNTAASDYYFDGYMAEVNFIDGQALAPSSFGKFNSLGVWQPIAYSGTYGTNGFYLPFTNNASTTTLGYDFSPNGNNWTTNNISVTAGSTYDSMTDVPTLTSATAANYCVLNPVAPNPSTTASTCTDGNLTASASAANTLRKATIGISSGAHYFEATLGSTVQGFGLGESAVNSFGTNSSSAGARTYYLYNGGANLYTILPSADTSITTTVGSGGTLAVAVDMTNKKLWLGYAASGGGSITWIGGGSPSAGTSPTHTFASDVLEVFPLALTNGSALYCNFGQRPFTYTPPTGYLALNTFNLSAGTVTTSGSFAGNASSDGPFVYLNGVPTAMTINGNAVTFGTNADKLANGLKVRSSSSAYNASGTNTYSVSTTGAVFKNANAQGNP